MLFDDGSYRGPQTLFDAARLGYTIKTKCRRCGNVKIHDTYALCHHWERKGWDQRIRAIGKHLACACCFRRNNEKVRHPLIELTGEDPTGDQLPRPDELAWKRAVKRTRS